MPLLNTYERPGTDTLDDLKQFVTTQVGILVGISGHSSGKNLVLFRNDGMEVGHLEFDVGDTVPSSPIAGTLVCAGAVYIGGALKYLTISRS